MPTATNDDSSTRTDQVDAHPTKAAAKVATKTARKTEERGDTDGQPQKTAAIIYNPIKVNLSMLKASVQAAEGAADWQKTFWFETSVDDPGQKVTLEALTHDVDLVLVAGGDGTVRAVAEALRGTGVPVALIPSGTGNLLARNLNLPLDSLDEAITTAFTGADRPIDVGVVDVERADGSKETFVFVVMAGLGLDAQMIANTDPDLKKRVGWIAYVDAIARSLRDNNRLTVRYNLDGLGNHTARVHTVLIGNCGSLPGNILLLPDASVDDGIFDIVALRPEGFIGWAQVWIKIFWENGVLRRSQVGRKIMTMTKEIRTLRYLKGKELVLRLEEPEEFELDGDAFGKAIAFKAVVDPLALIVKVPR